MATFSEAEVTDLAEILGTNSDYLDDHLVYYASVITESDKTKVLDLVTDWQAVATNYTSFTPTESNEGFNLRASDQKADLRRRIAKFVQFESAGYGQAELVRG